ncbi:single-stranded DNA-binding protein [Clostridium botulinum]|uniref:Single-stranded DNA-binding protein n=2 Tax=Clostridium botulinum TaxID=1491 RepID=A0A433ZAW4_CLOBO|nr:single-stranded DNA-binding protein [Clostridium botulinum]EKX79676.1 single-strand binding protein [Clostridium botulinum CFSAN001628]ACA47059.1 single-strand binding protein [Clostridium botulinum B1 str. Okra]ACA57265.1 single-strand binding protein [Clostridium botulinum A3 str. Loch Maree]KEI94073.1 single-stranded DNA-binding protein [Clostridium botulinum A2B7 92]MBD5563431.1 single-stranded DNA-binding protein [Clostridium botulinum]
MNKVVLIGRLTKDPELKFTPGNGTAVANFTLAVDRRFSKDGQREADFIPIVVWGKQAESTANYMSKGKLMGVSGRIQTRSYEAKDGTKRYITEVIAEEVKFLEWGDKATTDSSYNNGSESSYQSGQDFGNGNSFDDDIIPVDDGDIPF